MRTLVPGGWDARLRRRRPTTPGETAHPLLHMANFRLPAIAKGDYGSDVVAHMHSHHLLVVLKEFGEELAGRGLYAPTKAPWPLHERMANPHGLQRTLAGQSGIQKFFTHEGRAFCLYVVLGAHRERHTLIEQANEVLAHVHIGPADPSHTAHYVSQH